MVFVLKKKKDKITEKQIKICSRALRLMMKCASRAFLRDQRPFFKFFNRNKQHTGIDQRLLIIKTFKKRALQSLFFI